MENANKLFYTAFWVVLFIAAISYAVTQIDKANTLNTRISAQISDKAASTTNGQDNDVCTVSANVVISEICNIENYEYPYVIDGLTLTVSDLEAIKSNDTRVLGNYVFHRNYAKYIYMDSAGCIIRIEYRHV